MKQGEEESFPFVHTNSQEKNRHMLEKSFDTGLSIYSRILKPVRNICRAEIKDHTACTLVVSCVVKE